MSDVQTPENAPVTEPAPGLDTSGHTESPTENPPVTPPDPAIEAEAPADGGKPPATDPTPPGDAGPTVPDSSYIAAELDAIAFGITSGFNNGVERVKSLIRYVEQHI